MDALAAMPRGEDGATALTTLLGHKGDLMLIHFRRDFDALQAAQLAVSAAAHRSLPRADDVVRVGRRARHVRDDGADPRPARRRRAWPPGTPEFEKAFDAEMEEQRSA